MVKEAPLRLIQQLSLGEPVKETATPQRPAGAPHMRDPRVTLHEAEGAVEPCVFCARAGLLTL